MTDRVPEVGTAHFQFALGRARFAKALNDFATGRAGEAHGAGPRLEGRRRSLAPFEHAGRRTPNVLSSQGSQGDIRPNRLDCFLRLASLGGEEAAFLFCSPLVL